MIRSHVLRLRYPLYACVALALIVCALEVGLQIRAALQESNEEGRKTTRDDLLVPSWTTRQEVRPLARLTRTDPETGRSIRIETNSFGLRGDEPAVPKPAGVYRILCLGDETLFGPDVEAEETVAVRLGQLLRDHTRYRTEVLGAAVPGSCPLLAFLRVREKLLSLDPDLLVLDFDCDDVADDHHYRRETILGEAGVPLACPPPERLWERRRSGWDRFELVRWCRRRAFRLGGDAAARDDLGDIDAREGRYAWLGREREESALYVRQALEPIVHLRTLTKAASIGLVVAAHPAPWQVSAEAGSESLRRRWGIPLAERYGETAFEAVSALLQEHRIPFCDALPVFSRIKDPSRLYRRDSPDFSRDGHDLYARVLARYLLRNVPGLWTGDASAGRAPQGTR